MALTCGRCGAQNPDGNQFCSACGTPLTQAAAGAPLAPPPAAPPAPSWLAAPPQAQPPPPPPPSAPQQVAYASPYYAPAGAMPQAPVHRTPWTIIIAAVVILIVLMAGCGTALALLGGKTSGGTPDATPAAVSPAAFQGPTASNPVVTVPVPAGWTVTAKDNESITLTDPNAWGYVTVASGVQNPKQNVQQQKAIIDASIKSKSPDAVECRAVRPTPGTIGGVKGIMWHLCFTVISSGKSLAAEASLFVATNADGSVYYGVILLTPQSYMTNLSREAEPLIAGIQWKLT